MQKIRITILTFLMIFIVAAQVSAAAPEKIVLEKNYSTYLDLWGLDSVAIGNPDVADITVISSREVLIVAKNQGSTSLQVKFKSGNRRTYTIVVTDSDKAVAESIEGVLNYPNVTVSKVGDNIVLDGTVEDQIEKKRAETIAKMYSKNVVNLLKMENPKQIRIEAKIVEINSDKIDKIGLQYFNASEVKFDKDTGIRTVKPGTSGSFLMGQSLGKGAYGWFGDYAGINANLMLLINDGFAKVLSQPNVVTMSGEKANILIGGEIPVPISDSDGKLTVQWREYGIKLDIEPNAEVDNKISGKINAEVSTLDNGSSVAISTNGTVIPGLRSRKAETVITIDSGKTMAIGGLINSEDSKQITKVPLLGDLPILGQFFRSSVKNKDRREIVILITPTLVDENYKTPMSYELKSYIENKKEEQRRSAKSPEELKKEDEAKKEQIKAQQAKAKAEAEKVKVQQAQAKAEAEKAQKEQIKAKAEAEKLQKEQIKAKAEKEKAQKAEAERLKKEQEKAEKAKAKAEEARLKAEEARIKAEKANAEVAKANAEVAKANAEMQKSDTGKVENASDVQKSAKEEKKNVIKK